MTADIRELSDIDDVTVLEPIVLEFFRIVCGLLKSDFDVQLDPAEPTAAMMDTLDKFVPPSGRGYVAERDGVFLGMIFLRKLSDTAYEIKRLYIRTEGRGTGLGKRLVRHVIEAAKDLGATDLYLDSIPSLQAAISLYDGLGFQKVEPYSGSEIASNDLLRDLGVYMHLSLNSEDTETNS